MSNTNLHGILQLIADDAYAASFQSMRQYRTALLKAIKEDALAAPQQMPVKVLQFLSDVTTAAGLLSHGKIDKVLAERIGAAAMEMRLFYAAPPPAAPVMSDDDLWHIACLVTELNGGSLFNVIQRECVTAIRASFMNPDAGRALLASVQRADAGIPVSLVPWEEPVTSAAPAPAADEVEVLKRNSDRLNFIEKNWFYRDGEGCWCFNFTESWHAGKHETFPEAIDNARGITTPAQIAEVRP